MTPDTSPDDAELIKSAYEAMADLASSGCERLATILKDVRDPSVLNLPVHQNWPGTLLDWAIRRGCVECARMLIQAGADPIRAGEDFDDPAGMTLLHMAMYAHKNEDRLPAFIRLLKSAGLDFNANVGALTSLHYAVRYGSPTYARLLIEDGVWIDPRFSEAELEAEIIPGAGSDERPRAFESLRFVRSVLLERSILSALPNEDGDAAGPSLSTTL